LKKKKKGRRSNIHGFRKEKKKKRKKGAETFGCRCEEEKKKSKGLGSIKKKGGEIWSIAEGGGAGHINSDKGEGKVKKG